MEKENNKVEIYLNYKRNNKWLGIIDYKSLIFICVYIFFIVSILKFIPIKLEYLIYLFVRLFLLWTTLLYVILGRLSIIFSQFWCPLFAILCLNLQNLLVRVHYN